MRLRREDWLGNEIVFDADDAATLAEGITIGKNLGAESFVGCVITFLAENGSVKSYETITKVVDNGTTIMLHRASDQATLVYTKATGELKGDSINIS